MRCQNLKPYLDKELNPLSKALMRLHIAACPKCRKTIDEESDLSREIRRLEDTPVPQALRDKLINDAAAAAASASAQMVSSRSKPHLQGVLTMRRGLIALGLAAVIVAVGIGILPSNRGNAVIAQVAQAMEDVESAHLIGYQIRGGTDERGDFEVWVKQPAKFRVRAKTGADLMEVTDNGTKRVELNSSDGDYSATISPSKAMPSGITALSWFHKDQMLEMSRKGIVSTRHITLPDGRAGQIIELAGIDPGYSKSVITVDVATGLVVQVEDYREGKVVMKIERVKYNIDLPDSMFDIEIPKNAVINNEMDQVPDSPEWEARRKEIERQMDKLGGDMIIGGMHAGRQSGTGTPNHSSLKVMILGPGKTDVWYVPSRNAYYVFGKARFSDKKKRGYKHVVENGWVDAPYKPDRLPGILQLRIDRPGAYKKFLLPRDAGYNGFGAERIQNIGKKPLILMDEDGFAIKFYGTAKIYPQGRVYHDGERVRLFDIRSRGSNGLYNVATADFGNLPASEVKAMKAEMERHNRACRQFLKNEEIAREKLPRDAEKFSCYGPGYGGQDEYFKSDPKTGMTLYYIPGRDSIYLAGRAKLVQRSFFFRRVEKIVENEEIAAPGPEYREWYEKDQREKKQAKEYQEYRKNTSNKLKFDDWLKQHPELQ